MFSAELVKRAQTMNAPFMQCTTSFHIVGIGALMVNVDLSPKSQRITFNRRLFHHRVLMSSPHT